MHNRNTFNWIFFLSIACLFLSAGNTFAQIKKNVFPESLFSTYYHQRVSHFETLPKTKSDIIFLGNSISDGAEWSELFNDTRIKNRGISGDFTAGVLNRLDEISTRKPKKVFLLIGVNDLARNISTDSIFKNIMQIARYLKQETPSTKLFIQSLLPVNDTFKTFAGHTSKGEQIKSLNDNLKLNAATNQYTYIDLYSSFLDENGKLAKQFTNDGLHLKGDGYLLWKHLVYPYVFDLNSKPSLLPKPQQQIWNKGYFPLTATNTIFVENPMLMKEGLKIQKAMELKGLRVELTNK